MIAFRKFLYKPKKTDNALLAQFFYADEDLRSLTAELDTIDGKKNPAKCATLVAQLRQHQDRLLKLVMSMMDEVIPENRATRDFRVKYPDDLIQDGLAGQLWFGAECLSAGSSILNREVESDSMRPLAKSLTRQIDYLRHILRDQSLRNPLKYSDSIKNFLVKFDQTLADFELSYVSAMVPVKTMKEYDMIQDITVLFSETVLRAIKHGLITRDMLEYYDPSLMFTIPRLAVTTALYLFPDSPLNPDRQPMNIPEMFRPFHSLLGQIRNLLNYMPPDQFVKLERLLANLEEVVVKRPRKARKCLKRRQERVNPPISNNSTSIFNEISNLSDIPDIQNNHNRGQGHYHNENLIHVLASCLNMRVPVNHNSDEGLTTSSASSNYSERREEFSDADVYRYVAANYGPNYYPFIGRTFEDWRREMRHALRYQAVDAHTATLCSNSSSRNASDSNENGVARILHIPCIQASTDSVSHNSSQVHTAPTACLNSTHTRELDPNTTCGDISQTRLTCHTCCEEEGDGADSDCSADCSGCSDSDSSVDACTFVNQTRTSFQNPDELMQKLFLCISGIADQLQSNFACDLRNILKCVFDMHINDDIEIRKGEKKLHPRLPSLQTPPPWIPDSEMDRCCSCKLPFTLFRRRHHCRNCGLIFCGRCSSNSAPLPSYGYEGAVRICNKCYIYKINPFYMDQIDEGRETYNSALSTLTGH